MLRSLLRALLSPCVMCGINEARTGVCSSCAGK
jgi:hypothetical protein